MRFRKKVLLDIVLSHVYLLPLVLGNSRAFNSIFDRAQHILRKTFGMELVELQTRAELVKEAGAPGGDDEEESGKKKAPSSKAYILRSVLDAVLIEKANIPNEEILEQEANDQPSDDDENDSGRLYAGSILSWSTSDEVGNVGILYTILALILVGGRVVPDGELRSHLKRLKLPPTASIYQSSQSTTKSLSTDNFLTLLLKQGYLDRTQIGGEASKKGKGAKGGVKRVRGADETAEGVTYEWRWGPRAHAEAGEKAIAQFVGQFMVRELLEGDEDEDEAGAGSNGRARGRRY